jgi:hypothetical protein
MASLPTQQQIPALLALPEVLLYSILSFVAGPTDRAHVVCHELAPLSRMAADTLLEKSVALWEAILEGDYGVNIKDDVQHTANTRRASKRRRQRHSCLGRVKEAHLMVVANTDYCFYHLEEMTSRSSTATAAANAKSLTKSGLAQLLNEYGPHLRVNHRTKTGGTFLVSCCRARHGRECDILKCVKLLVETHHANVDLDAFEGVPSNLTPLAVAAARGMSTVVKYLLHKGASTTNVKATGRFRLHTNGKKSIKFVDALPLEFAQGMRAAEIQEGASQRDVKDLDKCVRLLL